MSGMGRREFVALLGGAAAWPLVAHAQPAMPMIGWMSGRAPEDSAHLLAAFQEGLRETGFVENESVTIEYRWARDRTSQSGRARPKRDAELRDGKDVNAAQSMSASLRKRPKCCVAAN